MNVNPVRLAVAALGLSLGAGCGLYGYGDGPEPGPGACFPSIAIGDDHTCVANRSGRVFCWGQDDHGQSTATTGGASLRPTPAQVTLPSEAYVVAAGPGTSCALTSDDRLWCWGARRGAIGLPDYGPPTEVVLGGPVYRIGLGEEFACAKVGPDDHVSCWGKGDQHRLGQNDETAHVDPVTVPGPLGLAAMAVGHRFACGLQGDGVVWCWGDNRNGQLGLGTFSGSDRPTEVPALVGIDALALGDRVACALDDDALRCWGSNDLGQHGSDHVGDDLRMPGPAVATNVGAVSAMANAVCALDLDGTVRCWGQNRSGELGLGDLEIRTDPTDVPVLFGARSIAAGYHQACAEKDDQLWCWGDNLFGQLGRGTTAFDTTPRQLGAGTVFTKVRGGGGTLCALDNQQRLWCWGDGELGQTGLGAQRGAVEPTFTLGGVREVAVGGVHTCARSDTTIWCWGSNAVGQLGSPLFSPAALMPKVVLDGMSMVAIGAGLGHTCAIASGVVHCWGDNGFGQLGDGTTMPRPTPVGIGVVGPVRLAVGGAHTCAVDTSMRLWCWGAGVAGQLGDGMSRSSSAPIQVTHPMALGFLTVVAGRAHTCALDEQRLLWCWGENGAGQLGSVGGGAPSPRQVEWPAAAHNVRDLYVRHDTTCAVLMSGEAKCWGADGFGALGPGGPTPRAFGAVADITSFGGAVHDLCAVRTNGELWCAGAGNRGQLGAELVGWTPVVVPVPCD